MPESLLIIGIGNDSRGDDGLGWAFLDAIAQAGPPPGRLEYRYQLLVEDAELLTRFPQVLFADASEKPLADGFAYEPCHADPAAEIYTHQQTPGAILCLCKELYGHRPEAWCLHIRGYEWTFDTGLSEQAKANLAHAADFFEAWLKIR